MSEVIAVTTTTNVTVMCTGALIATLTVMTASTSKELAITLEQNDVGQPPPLILMYTVRGVAGVCFSTASSSLSLSCLLAHRHMPTDMGPLQVSSFSELNLQ